MFRSIPLGSLIELWESRGEGMNRLTVTQARALKKRGMYRADPTLYLNVAPGGSKSWIQRLTIKGKRHDIGLGSFELVTMAEARDKAFQNRRLVQAGGHPLIEKRKARVPTFREAAEATFEANAPRLRNPKVIKNWMQQLERHAFGRLGDMPVNEIGREDVLAVLTPIWTSKPEIARKLRQRIRATLRWAEAHGHVSANVAGEGIDGALPRQPAVKQHFRALPYREVAAALETVEASGASLASKLCFRFLILCAARSGEARGATWNEIDTDAKTWTIPGERMKAGKPHRVPLSDAAMTVLEQARPLSGGQGLVFPSPRSPARPLSDMSLTKVMRTTGLAEKTVIHGLRSSFRDWCAETGKPRDLAEAALAHVVAGIEGAYFRSDLFDRRRALMDQWAAFVTGAEAKVVRLRG